MVVPASIINTLAPCIASLVNEAETLYETCFVPLPSTEKPCIAVAPGRVNLIGEHTDYTGGFVLPFAIDYSTVVYGKGVLTVEGGGSTAAASAAVRFSSGQSPTVGGGGGGGGGGAMEEYDLTMASSPPETKTWASYVLGTIYQYLPDLPKDQGAHLDLTFAISGNVPLGSGLSSSASLEVAVARFVESILGDDLYAFSSSTMPKSSQSDVAKIRALRCQKAENEWCNSPCGIMDQFVSSAATEGAFLLIDCRSLDFFETKMAVNRQGNGNDAENPVVVVANSNVKHDIGGGEYPVRVAQCKKATDILAKMNNKIETLRDASVEDVENAKNLMDDTHYRRARHVVTENERTVHAKEALEAGDWARVGELMNASHESMRYDYEVSCEEVDVLVNLAQTFGDGVYGSRLTGGGFGGCTVTLVKKDHAEGLMSYLRKEYKAKTGKDCFCFETKPGSGARLL